MTAQSVVEGNLRLMVARNIMQNFSSATTSALPRSPLCRMLKDCKYSTTKRSLKTVEPRVTTTTTKTHENLALRPSWHLDQIAAVS